MLELERFLPYRLSVLSNRVSAEIARLYAHRFRLTIAEWRLMAVLGRFGPLTASQLVEKTAMDKVRVSRAAARLAEAGRIARRVDPADRRRTVLELSARGRAVYDEVAPLALEVERRLLERLGAAGRADLERVLARLEAAAATPFAQPPEG
jgi:DNA-binding MarR family transcriptional regulator